MPTCPLSSSKAKPRKCVFGEETCCCPLTPPQRLLSALSVPVAQHCSQPHSFCARIIVPTAAVTMSCRALSFLRNLSLGSNPASASSVTEGKPSASGAQCLHLSNGEARIRYHIHGGETASPRLWRPLLCVVQEFPALRAPSLSFIQSSLISSSLYIGFLRCRRALKCGGGYCPRFTPMLIVFASE